MSNERGTCPISRFPRAKLDIRRIWYASQRPERFVYPTSIKAPDRLPRECMKGEGIVHRWLALARAPTREEEVRAVKTGLSCIAGPAVVIASALISSVSCP